MTSIRNGMMARFYALCSRLLSGGECPAEGDFVRVFKVKR